jgi:DNA-binding Xre family transcriptional regulator
MSKIDRTAQLRALMKKVEIHSFRELSRQSGVSEKQLRKLRHGDVDQVRLQVWRQLAQQLQVSLTELFQALGVSVEPTGSQPTPAELEKLQQEYQYLQQQMQQQETHIQQQMQQAALDILEPWMRNWPLAAYRVQQDPNFDATKLLKLVQPVEKLLQFWGVEAIASVGAEVAYDPTEHQLVQGNLEAGQPAIVKRVGYRHGNRLLYRAEVVPAS